MKNPYLDADFLSGVKEDEKPDTENRSLGQLATDVGIKLAEPVVTAARTVTGAVRAYEDDPHGTAADVDRWLGRQQKALQEEGLSPRQRAIDTNKWFNRGPDDRSAWDEPFSSATSQALGLVVPGVAAAVTGGGSAVGGALAGGALGVLDSGEAINNVRDYTDQTSLDELKKVPAFADIYRNNGGDELDARHQLFKQSVDLIDVATNVGANVLSIGTLGHALSRAGRKVDSGMMKFLGRAAFGATEGAVAGAAEGAAGETTEQRAAVRQGRQQDVDISAIVRAGEEAIPGMAIPVAGAHAIRRGPAHAADQPPAPGDTTTTDTTGHKAPTDTDVTSVLKTQLAPQAIDTGTPPAPPIDTDLQNRIMAQRQSQGYADLANRPPEPPEGPPGMAPRPPQRTPYTGEPEAPAGPQGMPERPAAPTPYQGEGAPPEGPAGIQTPRRYRPGEPEAATIPVRPPPEPPDTGVPGPARAPETPGAPSFPDIGRPGLPTPGDYGAEEQRARPAPPRTLHVTPQDAQKIRAGVRLVPGAGNSYTLETRGGQSIGRIAAHGQAEGLVPIGVGNDGLVMAKGRPLGAGRPATFDAGIRSGAREVLPPVRQPGAPPTLAAEGAAPAAGAPALSAEQLHAAPLRPGRATWRSNVGEHEVEILPDEETRGHHKVRYDITDKEGRHHRGEGWVRTEDLIQGGGPEGTPGPSAAGGGPPPPAGGGRPVRGTFQEQLRDAASTIFEPTHEHLPEEVEHAIRGGVATAPLPLRQRWADHLQGAYERRRRLMAADFPPEMQRYMDTYEHQTMVQAAAVNPQEVIDFVRQPPMDYGGRNPILVEREDYRLAGRKARTSDPQRGRFRARVEVTGAHPTPEAHVRAREEALAPATERPLAGERISEEEAWHTRQANLARQAQEEARRPPAEPPSAREQAMTVDERDLLNDINRHNSRVDAADFATLDRDERRKMERVESALEERSKRVNALRRPGQGALSLPAIREVPEQVVRPRPERAATAEENRAQRTQRFNEVLRELENRRSNLASDQAQSAMRELKRLNDERVAARLKPLPIPVDLYDAYADLHGIPELGIAQSDYRTAKDIADIPLQRRGLPVTRRAIWNKLSKSTQLKLQAADRARALPGERREIGRGERWAGIFRNYWNNLTKNEKATLRREAREGIGRTLSPEELRERVLKEVEQLHEASRRRAEQGLPAMPIRQAKIPGMRQRPLPRDIPTETEALDRMEDIRTRQAGQQRAERTRDQQYHERDTVVSDTLKDAIKKRFGTEQRFTNLIANIYNLSSVKRPLTGHRQAGGKVETYRLANWESLPKDIRQLATKEQLAKARGKDELAIRVESPDDYEIVKKAQLAEARKLQTFLDFALERMAKNLEAHRSDRGYTGGSVKWHLPQARRTERGVKGREMEGERSLALRPTFSAGSADEQFGAYSFTADLLNMKAALDHTFLGLDPLLKGGSAESRTSQRSIARPDVIGRKKGGRPAILSPERTGQGSSLQEEISRYMSPLNRQMVDFAWMTQEALAGHWDAIGDIRRGKTETAVRGFLGERMPEGEEGPRGIGTGELTREQKIEEAAARAAAEESTTTPRTAAYLPEQGPTALPGRDIGRGRGAENIEDQALSIVEMRAQVELARAYAQERRDGRLANMSFAEYVEQRKQERQTQMERDFPLRSQRRGIGPVEDNSVRGRFFHGTPFRWGGDRPSGRITWLTQRRDVASDYADRSIMGAQRGEGERAPHVRTVDVNASNVFDMRKPEHRAIFDEIRAESRRSADPDEHIRSWKEDGLPTFGYVSELQDALQARGFDGMWASEGPQGTSLALFRPPAGWSRETLPIGGHDTNGLPADRLPQREEFDTSEPSEREQDAIDAHEALSDPGTPQHPLVSPAETTGQVIDRVKQMIRDGKAGDLPTRYISDDFLDQLARITGGTEVYHAPYDAVSRVSEDSWAHYDTKQDRVVLSHDVAPDLYARSVLHETVHAAAETRIDQDPKFAKDLTDLLVEASVRAKREGHDLDRLPRDLYGLSNPSEFLAETISNQKFRDFLGSIKTDKPGITGPRTLLQAAYRAVRNTFARVMGFFHANTALDTLYYNQSTVLGKADQLVKRTFRSIERKGRQPYMPIDRGPATQHADGRYYMRGAGARAFVSDMVGSTQVWGKDVADRAKYAVQTRDKNRARGLGLMTQYDQTKIGRPEFREKSEAAFDTIEKIFAEGNKLRDADKRELDGAAKIFSSWSKGNRQRAAEGLIDESMHGYFADRELTDKGNEHFTDDLAHAQEKAEHATQQAEFKELSKLEGYTKFRDAIHRFSEKREEEMRKERIRDLVRYGNLLDPDLDPKLRERVSEAVRNWIDTKPVRIEAENPRDRRYENLRETLERVPDKALIKEHLDPDNPDVLQHIREIRSTPDMKRIPGPYVPFTRQGKFVVSGNLDIPTPANAILLEGDINHATGEPVGNDRFVFKTEEEARAFERKVTKELGVKQLDGGRIDIDVNTGRRAMTPADEQRLPDKADDPEQFKIARGKALEKLKEAGANIEDRYFVQFQRKLLYAAPTEYDAKKITDGLRAHYGDRVNVTEPKDIFVRDGRQNEQFVGTELQRQIDHLRQSEAFKRLDDHEQAAVMSNLTLGRAQYVMKRGVKQRYLPREYVKGASTNILGSLDEYSAYSGRYLAKLKHQAELTHNMNSMKDWLKAEEHSKDILAEQRVYNSMSHRLNSPTENPRDTAIHRAVDRALKWTMLDKLPGVGYFIANATDAVAVGLPLMAGRHGMVRSIANMAGMYRLSRKLRAVGSGLHDLVEAIKAGTDMTDYEKQIMRAVEGEPDGERMAALYKHAFDRGMFDRSANLEYQNTYMLNKAVIDRVGDYATGIFQGVNTAIEAVNRFVTLGTAYRMEFARLTKLGEADAHEQAVKYAMNIGHEANGVYANFNTPEWFNKGPLAKMVFQFKKYPQRIVMNYVRAAQGVIGLAKGEFTPENKERAKQLAYMLATQGILAGALGLPTEPFAIPLNAAYLAGLSKYNFDDAQAGFRQWAAKEFGNEGGQVVSHGALRYLTGTAIDQRMSQSGLITFGSPASRKQSDLKAAVFNFFFGATGGSAFQALNGIQKMGAAANAFHDGAHDVALKNLGEASRDLIPLRFVTDIIEAANRGTPEGVQTFAGRQMRKPYTVGEQLTRSIGLQPAREAEAGDARRDLSGARTRLMAGRKELTDEFVQSPPGAQREAVWQKVLQFNASNPGVPPLTRSDLLRASGTRQKAEKAPSSLLGLPDDKFMKPLRQRAGAYVTGE